MTRRSPSTTKEIEEIIAKSAIELGVQIDGISIKQLADSAGLAIGTIYRVLKTKDDLNALITKYCENHFNAFVFQAIPAKLPLRGRFSLVFSRIMQFIEQEKQCARFLGFNGFSVNSLMVKASSGFAAEGSSFDLMDKNIIPLAYAIIWGPISEILKNDENVPFDNSTLENSIWAALTARLITEQ